MTMSRLSRSSLLAIAATAAIAISALATTDASAWGRYGGGFRGHFGFHNGPILNHFPYRFGHWGYGNRWGYGNHWGYGNRWGYGYRWSYPRFGCFRFGWCYPHPRPIGYGPGVGALAATAAPVAAPMATTPVQQPTAQQPNCLVKQYLPNGAVQFADVCTQEQAIAMPNAMPQQPGQPGPQ
jgi:hypothetical protein